MVKIDSACGKNFSPVARWASLVRLRKHRDCESATGHVKTRGLQSFLTQFEPMNVRDDSLQRYIQNRSLVNVRRDGLDNRAIQGVPLLVSHELLLLQYVCDLRLDGLLLLRRTDITSVTRRETDAFQQQLLVANGLWDEIAFEPSLKVGTLPHFFSSLPSDSFVIVENEQPLRSSFWIGKLDGVQASHLNLHEFSGAGIWATEVSEIRYDEITCCQIDSNYLRGYSKYFEDQSIMTD